MDSLWEENCSTEICCRQFPVLALRVVLVWRVNSPARCQCMEYDWKIAEWILARKLSDHRSFAASRWQSMSDKIFRRLTSWDGRNLSIVKRITLTYTHTVGGDIHIRHACVVISPEVRSEVEKKLIQWLPTDGMWSQAVGTGRFGHPKGRIRPFVALTACGSTRCSRNTSDDWATSLIS